MVLVLLTASLRPDQCKGQLSNNFFETGTQFRLLNIDWLWSRPLADNALVLCAGGVAAAGLFVRVLRVAYSAVRVACFAALFAHQLLPDGSDDR